MTDIHYEGLGMSTGPRRISNSETSAFLQCERKWLYQYQMNLEPVKTGTALNRGIIGHECLAAYYEVLMDEPYAFKKAEDAAYLALAPHFAVDSDLEMLFQLRGLLERYFAYAKGDGWKILAVEQSYDINVNDDFGYVMRLDVLANIKDKNVLVDHKFVYNFYNANTIDMNCQIPKYIGALRFNKINVDYAMLNQILYRTKKGGYSDEETFQRAVLRPSPVEVRNVMREQFQASEQIMRFYADPDVDKHVIRTMNYMTCKNCSMLPLCKADLMEQDTTEILATGYQPNSYGYDKADDLAEV
jgi:hypothetical protein